MADINGTPGDDILTGTADPDTILGKEGNDTLSGRQGDDVVRGDAGNDLVYGNDGNDSLAGYSGDDHLIGGNGNDTLVGGTGYDVLVGGNGRDVFRFRLGDTTATHEGADLIRDFDHAENDKIAITRFDVDVTMAFIGDDAFSGTAGEVRYDQDGGKTYVELDTNGDGTADFVIALLGTINLVAQDFSL